MLNRYRINYRQSYYSAYEWFYVERRKWWFWWEEVDCFMDRYKAERLIDTLEFDERQKRRESLWF